ncbi:TIGR02391 family protein [Microbacterium sp. VKM Ac-2870]|uniref:TIGR02391 family protein n=1 Tax=Microbacterium sp. VKM Ac-2870 TaxID=2783825 RepID=UPI00188CB07A|nr:TIGR02391 family protein [Microbacterium sp. VKM Ac-2870]MBF4562076.1 TIGR02391 family protein [Microbacterium sp. VKM Ac-2870]
MTGLNVAWAIGELDKFIQQTVMTNNSRSGPGYVSISNKSSTAAPDAEVSQQAQVVEKIFDRVIPGWRNEIELRSSNRWTRHREAAIRAKAELERQEEIRENLGDDAPELSAANLHSWIWSGASSLWNSGHYREAVEGAIRKLNAETQNKLGRRDVSEADLFNQAFSEQSAAPKSPRLHRMPDDGSRTFKSVQRGARMFAEGVFAGIRNPLAHEVDQELPEEQALEYLAALSVLARWVNESTLEVAL